MAIEFLIATHNVKKKDELYRILSPLGIDVKTAEQAGIEISDVDETGETFYENAFLKVQGGSEPVYRWPYCFQDRKRGYGQG